MTLWNMQISLQLFNACPHTEIEQTFINGNATDDFIKPSLRKIYILEQEVFSHVAPSRTSN